VLRKNEGACLRRHLTNPSIVALLQRDLPGAVQQPQSEIIRII
jgi:hypothetical protein